MSPPTSPRESAEDFASRLRNQPDAQIEDFAEAEMVQGLPFIFANQADWSRFQAHIAEALGLDAAEVFIVGSALKGFSLAPDRFATPFAETSDIDIAIVDGRLFDAAWNHMLAWDYLTVRKDRPAVESQWLRDRRRETWRGRYDPTEWHRAQSLDLSFPVALRPLRDIGSDWFAKFQSLSRYQHSEVPRHTVEARLYRTRAHFRQYHAAGLREIKTLTSGGSRSAV